MHIIADSQPFLVREKNCYFFIFLFYFASFKKIQFSHTISRIACDSSIKYLHNTDEHGPMRQINPPFRVVIFVTLGGSLSANFDGRTNDNCEEKDGTDPAIEQVKE